MIKLDKTQQMVVLACKQYFNHQLDGLSSYEIADFILQKIIYSYPHSLSTGVRVEYYTELLLQCKPRWTIKTLLEHQQNWWRKAEENLIGCEDKRTFQEKYISQIKCEIMALKMYDNGKELIHIDDDVREVELKI